MPGLARQVQASFAGGMYRAGGAELIPPAGMYDATNCLLDLLGGVFKRGGTSYRSSAGFGAGGLRWIWDGVLKNGGQQTLVASSSEYARLKGIGEGFTALAHGGTAAPLKPAVYEGVLYLPGGNTFDGTTWGTAAKVASHYAIVANRLVAAEGDHVYFSEIGKPGTFAATDYHVIPGGVTITGLVAGRDSCAVFTTDGVWVISNMALNLTDAAGNVQQRLDHFSHDLILWGESGIDGWQGNVIVPGTDAIYLLNRGVSSEVIRSFQRISDPIRELYREYVKNGYTPGGATVYENHYLLPILSGTRVVDVLVCRLDLQTKNQTGAWTHLTGVGANVMAFAHHGGELMGADASTASRVLTCSYFQPNENTTKDADGSVPEWSLETRAFTSGQLIPNLVARVRARYVMWNETGTPEITAALAGESPTPGTSVWGGFVWGIGTWASSGAGAYETLAGTAPASPDGKVSHAWRVRKKARFVRFRFSCPQAVSALSLKSLEVFVRPDGRL